MAITSSKLWIGLRRDLLWQIGERGTRAALGFGVSVAIARALGPADFGTYGYALATIALFAFLGQAGLDALILRELIRTPFSAGPILTSGLHLRMAGSVCAAVASIAVAAASASAKTSDATLLVCILSLAGLLQAGWIVESLLLSHRQFAEVGRAKIAAYLIAGVLRLCALMLPEPVIFLAAATVCESLICNALLWRASQRHHALEWKSLAHPDSGHIARLGKLAMPMLVSSFTVAIYSRIDVFMLGQILGSEAAGLYTAGTLLSEGFYILPIAVMAAASPRLAALYLSKETEFNAQLHRFIRLLSASGLFIATAVTVSAPILLPLLFGPTYANASSILQIHIWSTWTVFVSVASDPFYINRDLRGLYLAKTATAAGVNIVLNFVFIPRWGPDGAAWATLVAYTACGIIVGAFSSRTRPLFRMQLRAMVGLHH